MEKKYLSVQEIATRWGVTYPVVRKTIFDGRLPTARLGGRQMRVEVADLEAYEVAAEVGSVNSPKNRVFGVLRA